MRFEGVRGTGCGLRFLADGESVPLVGVEGLGEPVRCSDVNRFAASNFVTANGGGNGDIESAEVEAVCAWYT